MNVLKQLVTFRNTVLLIVTLTLIYLTQNTFAQDTPTAEPTVEPTLTVIEPVEPTLTLPSPTPEPPTIEPTEIIVSTAIPTEAVPFIQPTSVMPLAPLPSVNLISTTNTVEMGHVITMIVKANDLNDVYGAALLCLADPAHLLGLQAEVGMLFTPEKLTVLDNGFQPDGQWALIASQGEKAPALESTGTLWILSYEVISAGATTLNCQIQLADRIGQPLPMTSNLLTFTIVGEPPTALPEAAMTAVPTVINVIPTTVIPTASTPIIVTAAPTPIPTIHLQGYIATPYPLPEVTVMLVGTSGQQSMLLAPDASFGFDVPSGVYQLSITAAYHLPYQVSVTLADQPILLPLIRLQNGDIDGNGRIDGIDVGFIVQNFGRTATPENHAADLNSDGVINIYDLSIISANIRN